ncbi:MAG: dihydrofolate reductase [Candidatus Zambryskibacteria bacterium]|nr:dihydrofolate reductase [Candidatus Zambryskibacteria bacterium]
MKWKVLVSSAHMQSRLDKYRELLEQNNIEVDIITRQQFVSEADLLPIVEPYHAIVCSDDEITSNVIEKAKNLKIICKWGVGINSIDKEAAKKRGIAIYNSPGAFSESCALMVFAYLMHFARQASQQDAEIRSDVWKHESGFALAGKTMGIIGMGNVGEALTRRARAFDMKVIGNDIKEIEKDFLTTHEVVMMGKEELLRQADFVVLSPDLNPTSFHLMSTAEFALMKGTAYLFNTSRGPVVDEPALVKALEGKKIAGAGLDVFEVEPLPADSPLRRMDNVILTPHNAYNTIEAENYVHDNTIKNLIEGLKNHES